MQSFKKYLISIWNNIKPNNNLIKCIIFTFNHNSKSELSYNQFGLINIPQCN